MVDLECHEHRPDQNWASSSSTFELARSRLHKASPVKRRPTFAELSTICSWLEMLLSTAREFFCRHPSSKTKIDTSGFIDDSKQFCSTLVVALEESSESWPQPRAIGLPGTSSSRDGPCLVSSPDVKARDGGETWFGARVAEVPNVVGSRSSPPFSMRHRIERPPYSPRCHRRRTTRTSRSSWGTVLRIAQQSPRSFSRDETDCPRVAIRHLEERIPGRPFIRSQLQPTPVAKQQ